MRDRDAKPYSPGRPFEEALRVAVEEAIEDLWARTLYPMTELAKLPSTMLDGLGAYILSFTGTRGLYALIPSAKKNLYTGKKDGAQRKGGQSKKPTTLRGRLRDHANSIRAVGLGLDDFAFRALPLCDGKGTPLLAARIEDRLVKDHQPFWNTHLDGFGNHHVGGDRQTGDKSEWDILHPGREWAESMPEPITRDELLRRLERQVGYHLSAVDSPDSEPVSYVYPWEVLDVAEDPSKPGRVLRLSEPRPEPHRKAEPVIVYPWELLDTD